MPEAKAPVSDQRQTFLVIGRTSTEPRDPPGRPLAFRLPGFHFATMADLDAELLARVAPDIVLSSLFGPEFDALELAQKLQALGFRGQYCALTDTPPRIDLVRREIQAIAPDLEFSILTVHEIIGT